MRVTREVPVIDIFAVHVILPMEPSYTRFLLIGPRRCAIRFWNAGSCRNGDGSEQKTRVSLGVYSHLLIDTHQPSMAAFVSGPPPPQLPPPTHPQPPPTPYPP